MNIGQRIEFHSHSLYSDGNLLPAAMVREAELKGTKALAITDHVDASNIDIVLRPLLNFIKREGKNLGLTLLPGVELSYIKPESIEKYAKWARKLGAKIIIVHGESPVESVYPGTNLAAVQLKGLVDILAHPGNTTKEHVELAKKNNIYLELSAKSGHRDGNKHVAKLASEIDAKMLVGTDCHNEHSFITQEEAFNVCRKAGLNQEQTIKIIKDNAEELLKKTKTLH